MENKEIIENIIEEKEEKEKDEDKEEMNLDLQTFMNDMTKLGDQIRSKDLKKPAFHYGDLGVTNYLLWLMLGEIMKLNDKIGSE